MAQLTIDKLAEILYACTGVDHRSRSSAEFADTEFPDLGCDSLAVLEAAGQVTRDYGVTISDDDIAHLQTPGQMLAFVQGRLAGAA